MKLFKIFSAFTLFVLVLLLSMTSAHAKQWTGCLLPSKGILANVAAGPAPTRPCIGSQVEISVDSVKGVRSFNQTGVCPANRSRFVDNGDGTICDSRTGLMWEVKFPAFAGTEGDGYCDNPVQANREVSCENNTYTWSTTDTVPNGTVFSDFLTRLNSEATLSDGQESDTPRTRVFFGNRYTDWRIPNILELESIFLSGDCSGMGGIFPPEFGPAQPDTFHWSSTSNNLTSTTAWGVDCGGPDFSNKGNEHPVRAVRGPFR